MTKGRDRFGFPGRVAVCAALFAMLSLIAGCADMAGVATSVKLTEVEDEKIAVMPVQKVLPENPRNPFVRCPLTGTFHRTCGEPGESAETDLEELFVDGLKAKQRYVVIPPERVEGVYRRVRAESFTESVRDQLRKVGEELGAEGVVAGYVYCYRERQGYTYAAEQPASAVFSFHLFDVRDGTVIWSGTFDKTQESLMRNVFDARTFFRGGGKWLTVKELSAQGMKELLKTFPERR